MIILHQACIPNYHAWYGLMRFHDGTMLLQGNMQVVVISYDMSDHVKFLKILLNSPIKVNLIFVDNYLDENT